MEIRISGFSDEICADFGGQLDFLNKLGVGYSEVRGVDGKNIAQLSAAELSAAAQQLARHGVRVSSLGSPIGKISAAEDFEPHFETFRRVCEAARVLGTDRVRVFSFFIPDGTRPEQWRSEVLRRTERMLDWARRQGLVLLHENEKHIYGDNAARCLDLMQQFCCDNYAAVFDFANFVQVGQDTLEAYDMLRPYIRYVHIKDAVGERVVPAGMGEGHVAEILARLAANGYSGFLSLEPHLSDFAGFSSLERPGGGPAPVQDPRFAWWTALNALKALLYDLSAQKE